MKTKLEQGEVLLRRHDRLQRNGKNGRPSTCAQMQARIEAITTRESCVAGTCFNSINMSISIKGHA